MSDNKLWYAIQKDESDNDWGTGSFDKNEAMKMAIETDCKFIAIIDANFDENGEPTTDGLCIDVIDVKED